MLMCLAKETRFGGGSCDGYGGGDAAVGGDDHS